VGRGANYYRQVLEMMHEVLENQLDIAQFEEMLRHFYLHSGWQLFAFDKLLGAISRFALAAVASDVKDKSGDMLQLFYKDREREETTHQNEINYRKQVEKLAKDGEVFRIVYVSLTPAPASRERKRQKSLTRHRINQPAESPSSS
jgi:paired amphipathic helix protein Sin3a